MKSREKAIVLAVWLLCWASKTGAEYCVGVRVFIQCARWWTLSMQYFAAVLPLSHGFIAVARHSECCTECWVSCHNACRPLYLRRCGATAVLLVADGDSCGLLFAPRSCSVQFFPSLGLGIFTGFVFTCNEEIRSELWCKCLLFWCIHILLTNLFPVFR